MAKRYTLIVVPHTHWDREWYSTFQQFRMRLVKLSDKLLRILESDPRYLYFVFDGQTVVLEDYLEIRPYQREKLAKYVQEERLLIGPWYVLPDEFLVSGEAMVHNLLMGHLVAEEFGRAMKAGYIPDPFGHIAQLPQILLGFGLDNAIFMRGIGDEEPGKHTEFWWEGLDGSRVLAIHQINSYCNASSLGLPHLWSEEKPNLEHALSHVKKQKESLAERATTRYLLLNNGCDHVEPQAELPEIIAFLNKNLEDAAVVHGTFETYLEAVKKELKEAGVIKGELHSGKYHPILSGVFSTRMYLKQRNTACQNLLEKWVEPVCAFASMHGRTYDRDYIRFAWKTLLKNHPHDSICGCSIDRVHQDMLPRFRTVEEVGEGLVDANLSHLIQHIDTSFPSEQEEVRALIVFNPHGWAVSEVATFHVQMPLKAGERPKPVMVHDEWGRRVPCQITRQRLLENQDFVPRGQQLWEFDLLLGVEDLPPMGYRVYRAEWGETHLETLLTAMPTFLENPQVRVDVLPNGSLRLTDKRSGTTYEPCLLLEDTEDAGDEYDYSPVVNSQTFTTAGQQARISLIESGPVRATIQIEMDWELPARLAPDRLSRSGERVVCPVIHEVSLYPTGARVDVRTTFTNRVEDHRLRAHFTAPLITERHYAETAFGVIERNNRPPVVKGWSQMPQPTYAMQRFVGIEDGVVGLAVCAVGLPEYEILEEPEGTTIALTLLRSVGWLSRDDYISRPYNAGPKHATPEAQCLGTHTFEYSILPYAGSWQEAHVWKEAHQRAVPMRVRESQPHEGDLPKTFSLFQIGGEGVVVSAFKRAERTDHLVLRVYNTLPTETEASITASFVAKSVHRANLNEQVREDLSTDGLTVHLPLKPFEIATLIWEV